MANKELIEYLKQHLNERKDKEEIRKQLREVGWSEKDIEEGFAALEDGSHKGPHDDGRNEFVKQSASGKRKTSAVVTGIILIFLLGGVGAYYVYSGGVGFLASKKFMQYQNKELGVQFKYPADMYVHEKKVGDTLDAIYITTIDMETTKLSQEAVNALVNEEYLSIVPKSCAQFLPNDTPREEVKLNTVSALKYTHQNRIYYLFAGPADSRLGWSADCNQIEVNLGPDKESEKRMKNILSSVTFSWGIDELPVEAPGVSPQDQFDQILSQAVEDKNPSLCNELNVPITDPRFDLERTQVKCHADYARQVKDLEYCKTLPVATDFIARHSPRYLCLKEIANAARDPSVCDYMPDSDIEIERNAIENCKEEAEEISPDEGIQLSIKYDDLSYCHKINDKMNDEIFVKNCIIENILEKQNPKLCLELLDAQDTTKIAGVGTEADHCLAIYARNFNEPKVCELTSFADSNEPKKQEALEVCKERAQ